MERAESRSKRNIAPSPSLDGKREMSHFHCVVWIDHREAHVIEFNPSDVEANVVHAKSKHEHLHHKRGSAGGSGKEPENHAYYQSVADAIKGAGEILIVGPSSAKLEFFKHLQRHAPALAACVVSVETVDHPTDAELLKFARHHFVADDRMRQQI
jgi:stalled ribosome rescue protein Dom34